MTTYACSLTGMVIYRCFRSSSPLEGYHLHFRAAVHPAAKSAGPRLHHVRSTMFDFVWNARTAMRVGDVPNVGHTWLWLMDLLVDIMRTVPAAKTPEAVARWKRTQTVAPSGEKWEPVTKRGVLDAQVMCASTDPTARLAALRSLDEVSHLLQHPAQVARGDALAVSRVTGMNLRKPTLEKARDDIVSRAQAHEVLQGAGVAELNNRLRSTATEAPQPHAPPAPPVGDEGAVGPLPAPTGCGSITVDLHTAAAAHTAAPVGESQRNTAQQSRRRGRGAESTVAAPQPDELANYGSNVWLDGERDNQPQRTKRLKTEAVRRIRANTVASEDEGKKKQRKLTQNRAKAASRAKTGKH